MTEVRDFFDKVVRCRASDAFFIAGAPPAYKLGGRLCYEAGEKLTPSQTAQFVEQIYQIAGGRTTARLEQEGADDFAFSIPGLSRFRANIYRQRGSLAAVVRIIAFDLPDPAAIGIPEGVMELADLQRGMLLVTGPAGSGKTTTIACLIDRINRTREGHIVTLEDPIEYLHRHARSIVSQREIGVDTGDYVSALRAALRQAPDVILVGEMRDYETIRTAMTAAETGHLVISTLHTAGAGNAIDRMVDAFPPGQQEQVRIQLSMVLRAVAFQQLVPDEHGGELPVFELLRVNSAVSNLIRDAKTHQFGAVMQSSAREGMHTMDGELLRLTQQGRITPETALHYCMERAPMARKLGLA